jgi:cellulose synthase (UDP-forming)
VQADVAEMLFFYLPYFVSQLVIMGWMTRGRVMPILADVTQLLAASQIVRAVLHGLWKPKGQKFQVTAKGGDRSRRFIQWPLLRTFLIYLGLTVGGVLWAFLVEDGSKLRDSSALCLFWSWYNIIILTVACVVCVEEPRLRGSERLPAGDAAVLEFEGRPFGYQVLDISLGGARLEGAAPAGVGAMTEFRLNGAIVPAKIVRKGDNDFALSFVGNDASRAALIRLLYSGKYSAAVTGIKPSRVAFAVLDRVMR